MLYGYIDIIKDTIQHYLSVFEFKQEIDMSLLDSILLDNDSGIIGNDFFIDKCNNRLYGVFSLGPADALYITFSLNNKNELFLILKRNVGKSAELNRYYEYVYKLDNSNFILIYSCVKDNSLLIKERLYHSEKHTEVFRMTESGGLSHKEKDIIYKYLPNGTVEKDETVFSLTGDVLFKEITYLEEGY